MKLFLRPLTNLLTFDTQLLMLRTVRILAAMALMIFGTSATMQAQKIGHVDATRVLALMPETADADSLLIVLRDTLLEKAEKRAQAFKFAYDDFNTKAQSGTLTPMQQQQMEQMLQAEYAAIGKLEGVIEDSLMSRRNELYQPVIKKLKDAIKAVAVENGYSMILDAGIPQALLFAESPEGIFELVKAKLGIK
jgi:outer membrane protein